MNFLLRCFDKFWFPEMPAARLAMLRIVIGLFALYFEVGHYSSLLAISRTDETLFEPVGVFAFLQKPLPLDLFQGMVIACIAFNVAFILGWRFRVTGPGFALLALGVLSYRNSWSMIYHSSNLVVLHAIVLALSPASDALSLDARRNRHRPSLRNRAGAWQYGWPVRLICALTVLTYMMSGVAKVAGPLGWSWASGEALRSQVAADAIRKEVMGDNTPGLFTSLYGQVWLFHIMAFGSLALELGAPLVLFNRRLAMLWAIAAYLMHWGIFFIMGITFRYQLSTVAYLSFFPLERIVQRRSKRPSPVEATDEIEFPLPEGRTT